MATKFLDYTGLAYLWQKIKAYFTALLALKADDINVVHKTNDELITGVKVFHTNEPDLIGRNKVSRLVIKNDNLLKGTLPAHGIWSQLIFTDNSNNDYESHGTNITNRLSCLETGTVASGGHYISIDAYKYTATVNEQTDKASLTVGYDENGVEYAQSPSTSSSRNDGQDILTRNWIPNDTRIVHTTGNENISGNKKFYNPIYSLANTTRNATLELNTQFQHSSIWMADTNGDLLGSQLNFTRYRAPSGTYTNISSLRVWGADGHWADLNINRDDSGQVSVSMNSYESGNNFRITSQLSIKDILGIRVSDILQNNGNTSLEHFLLYSSDVNGKELASLFFQRDASNSRNVLRLRLRSADDKWTDFYIARHDSGNYYCGLSGSSGTGINAGWNGNANTATTLATSRTIQTNLASTSSASFDGSANVAPGVTGVLPVANGGTGSSTKNFVDLSTEQEVAGVKNFISGTARIFANEIAQFNLVVSSTNGNYQDIRFYKGDPRGTDYFYRATIRSTASDFTIGQNYTGDASWASGAQLTFSSTYGDFSLSAKRPNIDRKTLFGTPGGTLQWNGQNIQVSSDERVKTKLSSVPDSVLDLWEDVEWGQFQYLDAVKEKGSSARLHVGLIAQQVLAAFAEKDFDVCAYGILCHEVRDASPEVLDKNGEVITPAKDAIDLWMARYTEALCMEAAYQRRKNKILENRISELEKRLAKLEGIV